MRASFLAIAAVCSYLATAADAQDAEAIKQRVIAVARSVSADDFSFTRTARVEQTEAEKTEEHVTVERFDPRKPANEQWTLVSIDGRAPNATELKNHAKEAPKRRVSHYGRVATFFGAPSTATSGANGRTIFKFSGLPKESLVVNGSDLSANATAEATVDASGASPFAERTRFTLIKPTRLMLVAKIERMEATSRYQLMPNGKPAVVEQTSDMTGSMVGKGAGRIKTTLTYTDHQAVRE